MACGILQPVRNIRISRKKILYTVTPLANKVPIFQHNNADTVKIEASKPQVNSKSKQTKSKKSDDSSEAAKKSVLQEGQRPEECYICCRCRGSFIGGGNEETSQSKEKAKKKEYKKNHVIVMTAE